MAKLNMVEAINLALRQEMERDPRVMLLGEDIGINGGVFRVTDGLQKIGSARTAWSTRRSVGGRHHGREPSASPRRGCGRWRRFSSRASSAPPTTNW